MKRYGLSLFFIAQFLVCLALYGVFLDLHQQAPDVWHWEFLAGVFENLQSEAFQVAALVIASTYLIHKGSPQSRDGSDRLEAKVDEIRDEVKR